MPSPARYWFRAKRYGWGWGMPNCWQGWLVYAAFFALVGATIVRYPPHRHPVAFTICQAVLCLLLLAVCWRKGEPPRWRWGGD